MFSYLLIGFEVAVLYFAFWFVFLRTPKPYKVTKDIWGTYEHDAVTDELWGIYEREPNEKAYSTPILVFSNTDGVHLEEQGGPPEPRTPGGSGRRKAA